MNYIKKFSPLVLGFILLAGAAFAQGQQQVQPADTVSDQELEMFVSLAAESQAIQQKVNMEMEKVINAEDNIDFQRFQMIQQSKQNPKTADSIEVTEEEQKAMQNLQPKLAKIGQDAQKEMETVLQENELTQQRIQQIQLALQADKNLQQRFQKEMMKQNNSENSNG